MSTENEGLLEVRDLKVHFPLPKKSLFGERSYVKAVDGVSFRVRKGTTFGIVGESGSGKTTIAKAVMGLVGVSGGSIRLEGNELVGIPEDRLKALRPKYQIVFQDPYSSLNPRMTVADIVGELNEVLDEHGAVCGGTAGRIDLDLEDERINPKYAQIAVKSYLQRSGFSKETAIEIGGMEIGIYE